MMNRTMSTTSATLRLTRVRATVMRMVPTATARADSGWKLFAAARPTQDQVLEAALSDASEVPELGPLVTALHSEVVQA